jgi:signal transduction histidine kinase/DNA-binding response OmpR family regulator
VLAISALIAVVLAGSAYWLAIDSRRDISTGIEQRATSYAALAVGPLCAAYETYFASGHAKWEEIVRGLLALNADVERLLLYDTAGRLLFDSIDLTADATEVEAVGARPPPPTADLLAAIKGLEPRAERVTGETGAPRYRLIVPYIEEWGRHRYSLVLWISYHSLDAALRHSALRIAGWAILALALGVLMAWMLAAQSLGPLEKLQRGALDLAEGNLDHRIHLATGDEFESLANAFDTMAARLSRSIGELEASNRALSAANRELQELDRLKSDLLANVSHELRTPLTAVQGYAEAMSDGLLGGVVDEQREALAVVQRNLRRLLAMIDQLLASSRLERGVLVVDPRPCDLKALAQEEIETLRGAADLDCNLRLEAPPVLPPVLADRNRIAEVFSNLLSNALKFTPAGGDVSLRLERQGSEVEVVVADTGIGIPAEAQARIFDRFYQVDPSSKRRYGGLGLGLAIVRELVRAHGREITVESLPGKGTRFRFCLPLAPSLPRALGGGRRILVVDADPALAGRLAHALRAVGLQADVALSAAAGQQRLQESPPDLLVLSRLLPDGDGFELISQLRARDGGNLLPVLALGRSRERSLALSLGATELVPRDTPIGKLVETVQDLIGPLAVQSTTVLIVDDEEMVRRLLRERLETEGLRVREAGNADDAAAEVTSAMPDLVVLDLVLPDLDGWELVRRWRAQPATARLPVVAITSRRSADDVNAASALDAELLEKPFDHGALLAAMSRRLGAPAVGGGPP